MEVAKKILRVLGVVLGGGIVLIGLMGIIAEEYTIAFVFLAIGAGLLYLSLHRSSAEKAEAAIRAQARRSERLARAEQARADAERRARLASEERVRQEEKHRQQRQAQQAAWHEHVMRQQQEEQARQRAQAQQPPPPQEPVYRQTPQRNGAILAGNVLAWCGLAIAVMYALIGEYAQAVMLGCLAGIGLLVISKFKDGSLGGGGPSASAGKWQQAFEQACAQQQASPYKSKRQQQDDLRDERKAAARDEGVACCPRCGSTSLSINKKGFGAGKAIVFGPLAGTIGMNRLKITCMNCGYRYKPGKRSRV